MTGLEKTVGIVLVVVVAFGSLYAATQVMPGWAALAVMTIAVVVVARGWVGLFEEPDR